MEHAVLETPSDRYVLEEFLAEGGMGAIYLGKKLGPGGFEKAVVLKQLLPEFTSEPQLIDLFLREARITASLDHANIVRTIDLVNAASDYFIVMEYVRGGDLRTLLRRARRRGRRLSPAAALYVGMAIADALAYAHARTLPDGRPLGLIHRDVSPSNILLSSSGEVKLSDFGIAKAVTHRSVFYKVKGKVGYMSPEQARGETLDGRSDLYALGVCVWEALCGERLFVGDLRSTPSMIFSQPVPAVSEKRPEAPPELDDVLWKALALDPAARYQSGAELQGALRAVAAHHGLLYSSTEMAAHLSDVCGANADDWLRAEVVEEGAAGTEPYAAASGARGGTPRVDEREEEEPPARRLSEGTQLTSILNLRRRAEEEREASRFESEPTTRSGPPSGERTNLVGPPPTGWPESALTSPPSVTDEPTAHLVLPLRPADPHRAREREPVHPSPADATRPYVSPRSRRPDRAPEARPKRKPPHRPPVEDPTIPRPLPPIASQAAARPRLARRWAIAIAVALVLATGVALGILLSDPGAEPDPPAQTR